MDYKNKALVKKIFSNFITGVYGKPKIPTKGEITDKLKQYASDEFIPILDNIKLDDIIPSGIFSKFNAIIDDVDILFGSIESESNDILNQLTNSLKEYSGSKREISRINQLIDDISSGKSGEEYIQSNYTETFRSLDNIDISSSDPVNLDAGTFSITANSNRLIPLSHYKGKRLDFSLAEYFSPVLENGFVGNTDADAIINVDDPRYILYHIKTKSSTALKVVTSFQLRPDASLADINKVIIDTDCTVGKGSIRLYYRDLYTWKDVPNNSLQNITSNSVVFTFSTVSCTHIKLEFIKNVPDNTDTNEYFIPVSNIAIYYSDNNLNSVLTSKPIDTSDTVSVIDSISCEVDASLPQGCNTRIFVAPDYKIKGQFKDEQGSIISYKSPFISYFDPNEDGYVYLSDIKHVAGYVSGLSNYQSVDYSWKELNAGNNKGTTIPNKIYFNSTKSNDRSIDALYTTEYNILYGDSRYSGEITDWIVSGWCNETNPYWSYLYPLVQSGIYRCGVTITTNISGQAITWIEDQYGNINPDILYHPLYSGQWLGNGKGYPYGYVDDIPWLYGSTTEKSFGWWRPFSQAVTPAGIDQMYDGDRDGYLDQGFCSTAPDYVFNNMNFYKIYKFSPYIDIVPSSIKLYSYKNTFVYTNSSLFNHNMQWKYKSGWSNLTRTVTIDYNSDSSIWSGYTLTLNLSDSGGEFLQDPIKEIRKSGTNVVFQPTEYTVKYGKQSVIIDFLRMTNRLESTNFSFDITYRYKVLNRYTSSWTGYIIVPPNISSPVISINNFKLKENNSLNGINRVELTNLVNGEIVTLSEQNKYNLVLSSSKSDTNYKLDIYCASDINTGFSALTVNDKPWFPSIQEGTLTVAKGISVVPILDPIKIVDFSSMMYDAVDSGEKAALITEQDGSKYLVVKEPSKDRFPGYYFSEQDRIYKMYDSHYNNLGHFVRTYYDCSGNFKRFTTGSSGNYVYNLDGSVDYTWNNGNIIVGYPNTDENIYFRHHSTYGYDLNLEKSENIRITKVLFAGDIDPCPSGIYWDCKVVGSSGWFDWVNISGDVKTDRLNLWNYKGNIYIDEIVPNRGFLYYSTGENLPAYYSLSYLESDNSLNSTPRFLYKVELSGNSSTNTVPTVRSIRFKINEEV